MEINTINRIRGCLYGQAIGDALGLGTEFMSKSQVRQTYPDALTRFDQIIRDRHRSRWTQGAWTDDTEMMLCILNGFDGRFHPEQIARNFKEWFNGNPLGIGRYTYNVLLLPDYTEDPFCAAKIVWELGGAKNAANGALMRTSVVGLQKEVTADEISAICRLTHPDPRCIGSCVIASRIINHLVWNDRETTYDEILQMASDYDARIPEWIELAWHGNLEDLHLDHPQEMGYTLRTLAAALWSYWHCTSWEEGLLAIVNEGGDADTNAAVACAILGAKYGYDSIPAYYIEHLHNESTYRAQVDKFISTALQAQC